MGLKDIFQKVKEEKSEAKEEAKQESKEAEEPEGKYEEVCALCGGGGTEKKWMGQYWHRKCLRSAKKASRKMI